MSAFLSPRLTAHHRALIARTPEQVELDRKMTRALLAARWINAGFGWWRREPTGPSFSLGEAYRRMGEERGAQQ